MKRPTSARGRFLLGGKNDWPSQSFSFSFSVVLPGNPCYDERYFKQRYAKISK